MATINTINLANTILNSFNGMKITFQRQDNTLLASSIYAIVNPIDFAITEDMDYYYVINNINIYTNVAATDLAPTTNPVVNIVIADNNDNVLISQSTTPFTILSGDIITFYPGNLTLFKLNKQG